MLHNMLISVFAFGIPIAFLSGWALIVMNHTLDGRNSQMIFLPVFGLPIVAITTWLAAKGTPRTVPGLLALLLVSPGIGFLSLTVLSG